MHHFHLFLEFGIPRVAEMGENGPVNEDLRVRQQDLDRLLDWMRRSGRPRSTPELLRFWLERLREEALRGR